MLCSSFKTLAENTWSIIDKSKSVYFQLKEETITDFNLLYLKEHHPKEIFIKEFTKYEEGKIGADWEWWFTDNTNNWIGFRIQAKIINISTEKFEHLHYQKKHSIYQNDLLIKQAKADKNIIRIPLYCLYFSTRLLTSKTIKSYTSLKFFGCSLLSAYKVRFMRRKAIDHIADIQEFIMPWHKMVCPSNTTPLVNHLQDLAKKSFLFGKQKEDQNFIVQEPPSYVTNLLSNQQELLALRNENNKNYEENPTNLAGVVIVRSD